MNSVTCFDVASEVINDATERFKPLMRLNTERVDIFKQYCEVIDELAEEFNGVSFEVEVDEITMEVTVILECGEIIIGSSNHVFYELVKRTIRYGFSAGEDDNVAVKFVFPCLWDRA